MDAGTGGDSGTGDGSTGLDGATGLDGSTGPDGSTGADAGPCAGAHCDSLDDVCNVGVCDPTTGTCSAEPMPDGTSCSDADPCTTGDTCTAGTCTGSATDCSGMSDMCHTGTCNPATGACEARPVMDGTSCDDGDACTTSDVCTTGTCAGSAVDCSGSADMCNTAACDPTSGACVTTPVIDGTSCDDGNLCTTGDSCTSGTCGGTAVDCSGSADMCNTGVCDATTGSCTAVPVMDGTSCDDTDACTTGDTCTGGVCGGTATPSTSSCAARITLNVSDGSRTVTGRTTCQNNNGGGASCAAGADSPDVAYRFTVTGTRHIHFETVAPTDFDTALHVRTTCGNPSTEVACDDDGGASSLSLIDRVFGPGTYTLFVDGFSSDNDGNYTLSVQSSSLRSCAQILAADPGSASGIYTIAPTAGGGAFDVYCDMTTDGGGWTLVASTRTTTLNDEASAYYDDLTTLTPAVGHTGVWDGMRALIADRSDIRFSCRSAPAAGPMTVDLSFYNTDWYRTITTGTDADSCFQENNGAGYDRPAPSRRDNVAGSFLPVGNDWNYGYLEGEDSCGDTGDFTVDFDDRGMDSNQSDGTDWGEDDSQLKCGTSGLFDGVWFIWVREDAPTFAGFATWSQNAPTQSDIQQDTLMGTACNTAFPGSRPATADEMLSGVIASLPATNTTGNWAVPACPGCVGISNSGTVDGHDRNCVNPGTAFPMSTPWPTQNCYQSSRSAICVMP